MFPDKEHFGRIFYNMSQMSALGIPQIAIVHGISVAGWRVLESYLIFLTSTVLQVVHMSLRWQMRISS